MIGIFHAYLWIAAIGFPIALPWALVNRDDLKREYHTGYDNGQDALYTKIDGLFNAIKHGDDQHQIWLSNKIDEYFYS